MRGPVPLTIRNDRTGAILGTEIVRAETFTSRAVGLLGRSRLDDEQGLWIEPCSSIHMFFMRFSIDVLFLDREARVVRAVERIRPWRVASGGRAARVALELPPGRIARTGSREGDRLSVIASR